MSFLKKPFIIGGLVAYLVVLAAFLYWSFGQGFQSRLHYEKDDKNVLVAADYDDVVFYGDKAITSSTLMVPTHITNNEEAGFRKKGLTLIWKMGDDADWFTFSSRFQLGDGLILTGDNLINKPFFPTALSDLIRDKNGFVVIMEFSPLKTSRVFFRACPPGSLIKGHVIGTRETLVPKQALWIKRVQRAVTERAVRFVSVRFSPSLTMEANQSLQLSLATALLDKGFDTQWAPGRNHEFYLSGSRYLTFRSISILIISILSPLFIVMAVKFFFKEYVLVYFFLYSIVSVYSGLVIYALGSTPDLVLGITPLRGIKLQLVLPLIFSVLLLIDREEWGRWLDQPIRFRSLLWMGGLGTLLLFFYLSRSGNNPLITVSDGERGFRDALESIFGARPRFKEFLFAHPFFLLGLSLWKKNPQHARLFVWLGGIGQISILNTFIHFHTPYSFSLLRTFHSLWLGALVFLPYRAVYRRIVHL